MPSAAALRAAAAMKEKKTLKALSVEQKLPLIKKASAKVKEEEAKSTLFDSDTIKLISRFEEKELALGRKLGEGGFCSVFEVNKVTLLSEAANAEEQTQSSKKKEFHTRKYMSEVYLRKNAEGTKDARYAIKRLSANSLADADQFEKGIADLATEAHLLAIVQHPNIIKVRGFALTEFCTDGFFIMMDRLYDTLDKAIRNWDATIKKNSTMFKSMRGGKQKIADLFVERIEYAYDLASAMEHLHSMKIIYRDLKPDNIGFDVRGDIKIFDFGLSKEVRDPDSDGTYKLTGYCGSPSYMAPEVLKCVPYNLSSDIYSFAIVLWEMMSLSVPYRKLPKNVMESIVLKGHRPPCDKKWPKSLTTIIEKSWTQDPRKRPGFESIKELLSKCAMDLGGDEEDEAGNFLDQSTKSFMARRDN